MIDAKIANADSIRRQTVEAVLAEFEKMMQKEVNEIDARIHSENFTAPESYISDMKGFSRGMSVMGNKALKFFRKKLLKNPEK